MIEKPKKERRFLKVLGRVGEILIQEVLLKVGSNLIKRIGGKKTLPSILFLFLSISLFAQFPNTGNKQRLGFQTTADGLVWRGSISDTASIQPVSNQNAWVILDTVNLKLYSFDFTSNVWNQLPSGTTIDTSSLSNRINLKLNLSDTSSMLTNYLRSGVASNTYLPLTGGTLTGDLRINKSSNSILRLSSADVSNYGKIIFNSNTPGFESNGASIESSGDGIGVDVGSLNFLTGFGTARTTRMTITPLGSISIVNSATIGGTLGVTGALNGTTGNFSTSLGVGTATSPLGTLEVYKSNSGGLGGNIFLNNNGAVVNNSTAIIFGDGSISSIRGVISTTTENYPYYGQMEFKTGLGDYSSLDTRMIIKGNGNIGINNTSPNAKLDVRGSVIINEDSGDFDTRIESDGNANMVFVDASTDRVGIGTASPSKTLDINGEVKIATVTATPTSLLGKDASNVVGEVTTVAQTGLMTRGSTTATTGTPSAVFTVTHGLGSNPTSVIVTGAGAVGAQKLIIEVYAKNSTTFSVQVWNYDGTEAASTSVTIYWLAIK
jgi:hypothetical protein